MVSLKQISIGSGPVVQHTSILVRAHTLYSTVDDSSYELESGPTRQEKDHSAFFLFSPQTGHKFSLQVYTFQIKKIKKENT